LYKPIFFQRKKRLFSHSPIAYLLVPLINQCRFFCPFLSHYLFHIIGPALIDRHDIWQTTIDTNEDTYTIIQQYCSTAPKTQATVVIVHSHLNHSGLYGRLIKCGLRQHYNILCIELPSNGLGHICTDSRVDYFDGSKHYLFNESLGHCVTGKT